MKIFETSHTFDHDWSSVTAGHWRKYPNPFNPAVNATDVLDRYVAPDGNLHSHRLLRTDYNLPSWLKKHVTSCGFVSEHSVVDPVNQTLTMRSQNVTFNNILNIEEVITYSADATDPSKTVMKQEARITVPAFGMAGKMMETQVVNTIATNAAKGRQALEHVINTIKSELASLENNIGVACEVEEAALSSIHPNDGLVLERPATASE